MGQCRVSIVAWSLDVKSDRFFFHGPIAISTTLDEPRNDDEQTSDVQATSSIIGRAEGGIENGRSKITASFASFQQYGRSFTKLFRS